MNRRKLQFYLTVVALVLASVTWGGAQTTAPLAAVGSGVSSPRSSGRPSAVPRTRPTAISAYQRTSYVKADPTEAFGPSSIASGDLLEISVFDVPELQQQVRVGSDGNVQLALIGSTHLAGLTAQQAAELIARNLRDRNFLLHPQVNVLIKEFTPQSVSVVGEVQHPGIYQIQGPRTLLDVISMAGGLTNAADPRVTIKHRSVAKGSITVNVKSDDARAALTTDVRVYPDDLVVVPRAGIVYVLGEVARPGGFVMQDSGKITLLQALAEAGSFLPTASPGHALLLRKSGTRYFRTPLRVDRIARGKQRDLELRPNDVVFIPNSRLKSTMRDTEGIASSLGTMSIYAILH